MKGYTLVETIIAILVIGIAFLGIVAIFTAVFTNALRDEAITTATMLAKSQMERVMSLSFSDVSNEYRDAPVSFGGNFTNYSWQVRVDNVPVAIANDPGMTNYKQVESRVTNPMAGDISLTTIVTNN